MLYFLRFRKEKTNKVLTNKQIHTHTHRHIIIAIKKQLQLNKTIDFLVLISKYLQEI